MRKTRFSISEKFKTRVSIAINWHEMAARMPKPNAEFGHASCKSLTLIFD